MNAQRSAELQALLEGIPLPASRSDLLDYARSQDASAAAVLEALPDGDYDRLDAVGEALLRPPRPPRPGSQRPPRPESGKPPGGDDYLNPSPESGAVRPSAPRTHPPQMVLEEQTQLQQKQKKRQEKQQKLS
jgi:hypothetical protein